MRGSVGAVGKEEGCVEEMGVCMRCAESDLSHGFHGRAKVSKRRSRSVRRI